MRERDSRLADVCGVRASWSSLRWIPKRRLTRLTPALGDAGLQRLATTLEWDRREQALALLVASVGHAYEHEKVTLVEFALLPSLVGNARSGFVERASAQAWKHVEGVAAWKEVSPLGNAFSRATCSGQRPVGKQSSAMSEVQTLVSFPSSTRAKLLRTRSPFLAWVMLLRARSLLPISAPFIGLFSPLMLRHRGVPSPEQVLWIPLATLNSVSSNRETATPNTRAR